MNLLNIKPTHREMLFQRLADDTEGAIFGAGIGVGLGLLGGFIMPHIHTLVPWGMLAGTFIGILVVEWQQSHAKR